MGSFVGSRPGGKTEATNSGVVRKSMVSISEPTKRGRLVTFSIRAISSGVLTNPMADFLPKSFAPGRSNRRPAVILAVVTPPLKRSCHTRM
jgi:hypothetical protein